MNKSVLLYLVLIFILQGGDVLLHVATGQAEVVRIASNVIVSVGAIASVFAAKRGGALIWTAAGIYLAMNLGFLVQNGLINPANDNLRFPLFGFVVGSLTLMALLKRQMGLNQRED